jgi:predicted ATPase/uncharacterized protein HemY/transcriptional regulator with XRE-family HTH domain
VDSYSFYSKTRAPELETKRKYQPHELLVMLRQRSGLSKTELAHLLGFNSERMLQKWEGGYALPTAERLIQLIEIYYSKDVFVAGKELEEVRLLWTTIQNFYDATHPSYEGYPVFDASWFEKLLKGQTPVNLLILPLKPTSSNPSLLEPLPPVAVNTPTNLPALELTQFIGRQQELNAIAGLLRQESCRLVTLSGTGGIGKTRLALQVVRQILPDFKDGVWLVELAGLSTAEQLPLVVAETLSLIKKIPANDPVAGLQTQLKTKQLLLVLDNCEHLVEGCAKLAASLLTACPNLQILATSREPLGILGESVFPVLPLTFPTTTFQAGLEDLMQFEAVQLFYDRARLIEPDFERTELNTMALAQICQKLDGIPLALELAAARLTSLTLEQINDRLADRFKLLTKGNRTALPRHQTLRSLLDWSFQLLSPEEQRLFIRLAVFRGGSTLAAVETICSSNDLAPAAMLDCLDNLVAKSLVVVVKQDQISRYHMLETIHEFANEHFAGTNDAALFQERHALYYVQLAEQAEAAIETPEQTGWLNRLEKEHENIVRVLNWLFELQNNKTPATSSLNPVAIALHLATALARYWHWRGYGKQVRQWLEQALEAAEKAGILAGEDEVMVKHTASSLLRLSQVVHQQDETEVALAYAKRGLALAEKIHDKANIGLAHRLIGQCFIQKNDYSQATTYIEQSLAGYQEIDHHEGIGSAFFELSVLAYLQNQNTMARQLPSCYNSLAIFYREEGDYPKARHFLEKGIALCREINNRISLGLLQVNLAGVSIIEGHYAQAQETLAQALIFEREVGNKQGEAASLHSLGWAAKCLGDYSAAQDYYQQALAIRREIEDARYIATTLNNLGEVAILQNDYQRASELLNTGLADAQKMHRKMSIAQAYLYLGYLAYKKGDYLQAKTYLEESLEIYEECQNQYEISKNLTWLVCLAQKQGKIEEARMQADRLTKLLAKTTGVLEPHYQAELVKALAALQLTPSSMVPSLMNKNVKGF